MLKRSILAAGALTLLASSAFAASVPQSPVPGGDGFEPVASCGWYAIYRCSKSYAAADEWANNSGLGYVIDTDEYDNFRPGWYCVVEGPMSRNRAQKAVRDNRDISHDGYAKYGCYVAGEGD